MLLLQLQRGQQEQLQQQLQRILVQHHLDHQPHLLPSQLPADLQSQVLCPLHHRSPHQCCPQLVLNPKPQNVCTAAVLCAYHHGCHYSSARVHDSDIHCFFGT